MEQKEIIENNVLIGKFMGLRIIQVNRKDVFETGGGAAYRPFENCSYHKDWNELMEVVERIETLEECRWGFTIDPYDVAVLDYANAYQRVCGSMKFVDETKLFLIYDTVIQFIKWYNAKNNY